MKTPSHDPAAHRAAAGPAHQPNIMRRTFFAARRPFCKKRPLIPAAAQNVRNVGLNASNARQNVRNASQNVRNARQNAPKITPTAVTLAGELAAVRPKSGIFHQNAAAVCRNLTAVGPKLSAFPQTASAVWPEMDAVFKTADTFSQTVAIFPRSADAKNSVTRLK